jgi:hypothetical protein
MNHPHIAPPWCSHTHLSNPIHLLLAPKIETIRLHCLQSQQPFLPSVQFQYAYQPNKSQHSDDKNHFPLNHGAFQHLLLYHLPCHHQWSVAETVAMAGARKFQEELLDRQTYQTDLFNA